MHKNDKTIEMKLLIMNLKNLVEIRKKQCFWILVQEKEKYYYESIIKNIFPLTNMIGVLSLKIKEKIVTSFERIQQIPKFHQFLQKFPFFAIIKQIIPKFFDNLNNFFH